MIRSKTMHLSMHNWMRAEPIDVTVRRLARYGYKSIEISGEPDVFDTKELRQLLADNGIACWGAVSLMFEGRDLIHADEAVRASSIEYLNECITMVKELDGYEMTVVPSQVGKVAPMDTPEQEWAWAVESLKEVYAHAQKEGIRIALEPLNRFETNFLNRADQAVLLAEEVGSDCGVCLDTFHLNIEEADMIEAIKNSRERLVDFHVADNNRMACGMGALDWPLVVKTLREIGYDGALTVEFVAPLDRTPANPYQNAVAAAEQELTAEQLQFIQDHGSGVLSEEFYGWLVEETAKTLLPLI
ncbi:MAG: sugar phosphate isomerase/epimerase [Caldilineaceae bacterium]|nr:sugar phosphate isomerase/epimerase [Caldilineaceae bacterium]MDE0336834.1 sugar phosphate isomerase/epimerase [Caldilineaceae bacterium]